MISNIKISNYKIFKELDIPKLSQVLLVGGKNGRGKSSLLEAIFFVLDCANPGGAVKHLSWRNVGSVTGDMNSFFAPAWHNLNMSNSIKFNYKLGRLEKFLEYSLEPSRSVHNNRNGKIISMSSASKLSQQQEGRIKISSRSKKNGQIQTAYLNIFKDRIDLSDKEFILQKHNDGVVGVFCSLSTPILASENAERYGKLDQQNDTGGFINALKVLLPELRTVSVIPLGNQSVLHGDMGIGKKIPLALMGQGVERLASILLAISHAPNGIVLIDELENGFHYQILTDIWRVIVQHAKSNNVQIIATTHSGELISSAIKGVPEESLGCFNYLRLDKSKDGTVKTCLYDFENLSSAIEHNIETR